MHGETIKFVSYCSIYNQWKVWTVSTVARS